MEGSWAWACGLLMTSFRSNRALKGCKISVRCSPLWGVLYCINIIMTWRLRGRSVFKFAYLHLLTSMKSFGNCGPKGRQGFTNSDYSSWGICPYLNIDTMQFGLKSLWFLPFGNTLFNWSLGEPPCLSEQSYKIASPKWLKNNCIATFGSLIILCNLLPIYDIPADTKTHPSLKRFWHMAWLMFKQTTKYTLQLQSGPYHQFEMYSGRRFWYLR